MHVDIWFSEHLFVGGHCMLTLHNFWLSNSKCPVTFTSRKSTLGKLTVTQKPWKVSLCKCRVFVKCTFTFISILKSWPKHVLISDIEVPWSVLWSKSCYVETPLKGWFRLPWGSAPVKIFWGMDQHAWLQNGLFTIWDLYYGPRLSLVENFKHEWKKWHG